MAKKTKKKIKTIGRPTKFSDALRERIIGLAKEGKTDEQLSDLIGVTRRTFQNWKSNHPDFLLSLKAAKSVADELVEVSLFQRAVGYTCQETKVFSYEGEIITHEIEKHYPPEVVAQIFWLKNRQPDRWRDKTEISGSINHRYEDLSDAEIINLNRKRGLDLPDRISRCLSNPCKN